MPVSGRVFLDANANACYDEGEKGLGNVAVTDGVQFARTGRDGRYRIDAGVDALVGPAGRPIVSVSFPSGTWPVAGWFRRLEGAADAANVDFPLRADEQKLPMRFVHATDSHVPRGGKDKFLTFRSEMAEMADRVRFCVLTGDLVDLSDSRDFARAKAEHDLFAEQTKEFPVPLFCIPGNHDAAGVHTDKGWEPGHPMYGYGFYRRNVGPLRWSFNWAGVHFVGIDFLNLTDGKWLWGPPASAIAWLEADLKQVKRGARVLLFVHSPVGQAPSKDAPPERVPRVPTELLRRYKVTQIFAGHSHTDRQTQYGGVPMMLSGSLSQVFEDKDRSVGYRLVRVTDEGLDTFFKATGQPHAITVDYPRYTDRIRPGDTIRGAFFDPKGEITKLTVKVDDVQSEVPFTRGPLCCRFAAKLDLAGIEAGPHRLEVAVTDGRQTWRYAGIYPAPKK